MPQHLRAVEVASEIGKARLKKIGSAPNPDFPANQYLVRRLSLRCWNSAVYFTCCTDIAASSELCRKESARCSHRRNACALEPLVPFSGDALVTLHARDRDWNWMPLAFIRKPWTRSSDGFT